MERQLCGLIDLSAFNCRQQTGSQKWPSHSPLKWMWMWMDGAGDGCRGYVIVPFNMQAHKLEYLN